MTSIRNNEIARAIYLSTEGKTGSSLAKSLSDVVNFLYRKRLLSKSKEILEILRKIINQEEGILIAKVISFKKLQEETKKDLTHLLKKRYSAKEVIFEEKLDEKLLGGMRIEVNNEVIDLTIKNKIWQLQEYLKLT